MQVKTGTPRKGYSKTSTDETSRSQINTRGQVMRKVPVSKLTDRMRSLWLQYCPNCEPPGVMTIKTIRPAMCRGHDMTIYECEKCGHEMIYKMM
jgi:predicted RNA-binding Zn-ribbon protein involved in translation (DUF1610 family)